MKKSTIKKFIKTTTSIFACAIIIGNANILLPPENPNDSIVIESPKVNPNNENPDIEHSPLGDEAPFIGDPE